MANNKTGSSISPAKLKELRERAKNKRAGSSSTYKASSTGSSISAAKLAELKKKAKDNAKKPVQQKVPSIIAEMRSKSGQGKATVGKAVNEKKGKPTVQKVPSIIAELLSKKPNTPDEKTTTTVVKKEPKKAPKKEAKVTKTAVKSNEVNYNVGVSKGGVSFNKAFAHFRKKGAKTFTWNGKKYTTELAKSGKKSKPKGMAV